MNQNAFKSIVLQQENFGENLLALYKKFSDLGVRFVLGRYRYDENEELQISSSFGTKADENGFDFATIFDNIKIGNYSFVGIRGGSELINNSYLLIIDIDDDSLLDVFKASFPEINFTFTTRGSKGAHFYITTNIPIKKSKIFHDEQGLQTAIDLLGVGGFAIAPPSINRRTGKEYTILNQTDFVFLDGFEFIRRLHDFCKTYTLFWKNPPINFDNKEEEIEQTEPEKNQEKRDVVAEMIKKRVPPERFGLKFGRQACFLHPHKTPQNTLLVNDNPDGFYAYCFATQECFDCFRLYMKQNNCDFKQAKRELAKEYGIEYEEEKNTQKNVLEISLSVSDNEKIIVAIDYEKRIITLNNKIVFYGVPEKFTCFYSISPEKNEKNEEEIKKIETIWLTPDGERKEFITSGLQDLKRQLLEAGITIMNRRAEDVINAVYRCLRENKKNGIYSEEVLSFVGFSYDYENDKIIFTPGDGDLTPKKDIEKLKEALQVLDEVYSYFDHIPQTFSAVIRYALISPFSFTYRQKFRPKYIPHLYLYGSPQTGKTTLASIAKAIYGVNDALHTLSGASTNTEARFGDAVSKSTFPIEIKEPQELFKYHSEIIKSSIEELIARSKFEHPTALKKKKIPSLAYVIYTSNHSLTTDTAKVARFSIFEFTADARRKIEKNKRKFEKEILPKLHHLKAIGEYVANEIMKENLKEDWNEQIREIIKRMYNEINKPLPEWFKYNELTTETAEDVEERTIEIIRSFLYHTLVDASLKHRLTPPEADVKEKIKEVLRKKLIPWCFSYMYKKRDSVIITSGIFNQLKSENITSLKALASLFNPDWVYKKPFSLREGNQIKTMSAIIIDFENFINFLCVEPDDNDFKENQEFEEPKINVDEEKEELKETQEKPEENQIEVETPKTPRIILDEEKEEPVLKEIKEPKSKNTQQQSDNSLSSFSDIIQYAKEKKVFSPSEIVEKFGERGIEWLNNDLAYKCADYDIENAVWKWNETKAEKNNIS